MPNLFDPIGPIVNAVLAFLWSAITTILQNATQAMLMGTITLLMASPWPNLASSGFMTLWNNGFGLVILASFAYLAISVVFSALSAKDTSAGENVVWTLKNFAIGAFMLVLVLGGMAVSSLLMTMIAAIVQSVVGTPDWGNVLLQDRNYSQADAIAQFLAFNVTSTNSTVMYMYASVAGGALMMYLLWYLFAGLLGNGFFGKVIRSLILAMVFTQVFARVAQVLFLGIGAMITHWGIELGFAPIGFAMTSAIASTAALWAPPIMLVVLTVQFYKHEKALDPQLIAQGMAGQQTTEFSTQKLNSRRAEAMTSPRSEKGREVLRAVAVTGTIAAMAKVTSMVLAKIPTPQTKTAALGVGAIGLGSKVLQNYAAGRVGARVSRVGRSTTSKST